jgi:hypothetical protein
MISGGARLSACLIATCVEAVEHRHLEIEDHCIRTRAERYLDCLPPVKGHLHGQRQRRSEGQQRCQRLG